MGWVGGPGRVGIFYVDIVPSVTGMILVDSILDRNWAVFKDALTHIVLPASLLGYYSLAYISRMTRSFMLEQLSAEYITTARVKGMSESAVIWRHAFKNIRVQLITVIALSYANLLEGSVYTKQKNENANKQTSNTTQTLTRTHTFSEFRRLCRTPHEQLSMLASSLFIF